MMTDYKNYILEIEGVLHQLLEEMTNNQALDEIERRRGKSARMEAEGILKAWEKEYAFP